MHPNISNVNTSMPLPIEHRQAMIEALYRRLMDRADGAFLDPARVARMAVMSDEDVLGTLLECEADGDLEVAKVLAQLGYSEVPVMMDLPVVRAAGTVDSPDLLRVGLSVSQLRQLEVDHFTVRDLNEFGSLRLDLPAGSYQVGYSCGEDSPGAGDVLHGSAVLTTAPSGEPMLALEVERAVSNQLDSVFRSRSLPLATIREMVANAVCRSEMDALTNAAEGVLWVDSASASHPERCTPQREA